MKIYSILIFLFSIDSYALSDTARMVILMKAMQNNQMRTQADDANMKEKESASINTKDRISGKVVHAQAEEGGQSVAIFETKECGKLGYIPTDFKKAKDLETVKEVNLKVKNCEIIDVTPK